MQTGEGGAEAPRLYNTRRNTDPVTLFTEWNQMKQALKYKVSASIVHDIVMK